MARGIAVLALLALAAMVAADEYHKASDVIYDEDDDMDLPAPPDEDAGRERRQVPSRSFAWMGAPFQQATCRLIPATGMTVQGHLYLFQKQWRYQYVKVKGSLWGMTEPKERFEVTIHDRAPPTPGDCAGTGDTLFGTAGYEGYLGQVKAKGYGRATGFSRSSRAVTLEPEKPNSIGGRSIVVTSLSSRNRVACCTIQVQ